MSPNSVPTSDAPAWGVGVASRPTLGRSPLNRQACLALLASGGRGRVAATMKAVPVIIPVHFTLIGDDVIFSPGSGEGLSKAVADSVLAFETEQASAEGSLRWSVHATGVARALAVQPSPAEPMFRLSPELLTGWRSDD